MRSELWIGIRVDMKLMILEGFKMEEGDRNGRRMNDRKGEEGS